MVRSGEDDGPARRSGVLAALNRLVDFLCWAAATLAGAVVLGVSLAVVWSVAGSALGFGGIRGEFELVEYGCGVSAFLFLPLCQFRRGHIIVDLFSNWLPARGRYGLEGLWEIVFAAAWLVIAWRFTDGMAGALEYDDRSMLLKIPLWAIYVPALFGAVLSAIVAIRHGVTLLSGRAIGHATVTR
ncbi:TRAP transporter small permease [Chelativorans salis]|uniref:TRAP transporter small permease protein n=1 Tax=Chelativorans salis TaxID=2978478 RepID=A0ABT2LRH1_9HYPH|nr:TRAP transporter small permease [Chelativorans sp. EGI FJ00035]MCT7377102.1 TRAP transporter small permease [Chelativorans sp. EGI FJ00035]